MNCQRQYSASPRPLAESSSSAHVLAPAHVASHRVRFMRRGSLRLSCCSSASHSCGPPASASQSAVHICERNGNDETRVEPNGEADTECCKAAHGFSGLTPIPTILEGRRSNGAASASHPWEPLFAGDRFPESPCVRIIPITCY
jgi:hypothetical protein